MLPAYSPPAGYRPPVSPIADLLRRHRRETVAAQLKNPVPREQLVTSGGQSQVIRGGVRIGPGGGQEAVHAARAC